MAPTHDDSDDGNVDVPATPPAIVRLWRQYERRIYAAAVVALLAVGVLYLRGFWIGVQSERAHQELSQVAVLPDAKRVEHLEIMASRYGGTDAGLQIRYTLGLAQRDAGQLESAERTLRQIERDAPGSEWGRLATEAVRGVAEARASEAATSKRLKELEALSREQRGAPATAASSSSATPAPGAEPAAPAAVPAGKP
jgi:hypothetical protein